MIKINPLYGSRSLKRDFAFGFLIIIVFISVLVFTISGLIFNKIQGEKFYTDSKYAYLNFKDLIVAPLWHYDDAEIAAICQTFISSGRASKIVLYSEDNREMYAFGGSSNSYLNVVVRPTLS